MKIAALALLAATAAAPDVLYKGKTARYWGVAFKGQLEARKAHERTILRQRKQIVELTRKPEYQRGWDDCADEVRGVL